MHDEVGVDVLSSYLVDTAATTRVSLLHVRVDQDLDTCHRSCLRARRAPFRAAIAVEAIGTRGQNLAATRPGTVEQPIAQSCEPPSHAR